MELNGSVENLFQNPGSYFQDEIGLEVEQVNGKCVTNKWLFPSRYAKTVLLFFGSFEKVFRWLLCGRSHSRGHHWHNPGE